MPSSRGAGKRARTVGRARRESVPARSPRTRAPRIDAHVHLSAWWPDIRRTGYRPDLDYSVAGVLREMDRSRVDRALAIAMFQAPSEVEALSEGERLYAESQGRLLPVATVDPTRGEGSVRETLEAIERSAHVVGIKLFPGYRPFYPHDPRLEPVYELAERRGLPVLIHQGDTLDGLGLLKFARPVEVDEVAGRFRGVRFILCHLGNPWIDEAVGVLYKNPNVYADTSGLLGPPASRYFSRAVAEARRRLALAIVGAGSADRLLYGSDWPLEEIRVAVGLVKRLALDPTDREAILGGNASRLFSLPPADAEPSTFSSR